MKIAFISSEVYPFAKTGGLADVSYSLTKSLAKAGHNVCVFMPRYGSVDKEKYGIKLAIAPLIIKTGTDEKYFAIFESSRIPGVKTYFIDYESYFAREGLYGDHNSAFGDNGERFDFFARAVILGIKEINFIPDIIHCNDWHTGLIPAYLKTVYGNDEFFKKTATVITVHNAGYQGTFPEESLGQSEYYRTKFGTADIEETGETSFLKEGVLHSDIITTVSKKYAEEIQTQEYGRNMAAVFGSVKKRLHAIPNAVDYDNWNPETDTLLPRNFSFNDIRSRSLNKPLLQKEMEIEIKPDIPLLGTISRITFQKGMDVLAETLEILFQDEKFQFVISGSGDNSITKRFDNLKKMFPQSMGIHWGFDEDLEHLFFAGLDIFIMPSRYEPCGLTQMYSLKYGAVPVVRATGGLDEIIEEWNERTKTGNGFKFNNLTQEELYNTTRKVIKKYYDNKAWRLIQKNGMSRDYSWDDAVKGYEKLYRQVLK